MAQRWCSRSPEDVQTSRALLQFELPIFADGFES